MSLSKKYSWTMTVGKPQHWKSAFGGDGRRAQGERVNFQSSEGERSFLNEETFACREHVNGARSSSTC